MKKKALLLIIFITTMLFGLKSVFAEIKTCVYQGEWSVNWASGPVSVSVPIDTSIEPGEGDATFITEAHYTKNGKSDRVNVEIVSYHHPSIYGTKLYPDGIYTFAEYFKTTRGTCPKYMTILNYYGGDNAWVTLLHSSFQYETNYDKAAELTLVSNTVNDSAENPAKKCDYKVKVSEVDKEINFSYFEKDNSVFGSSFVKLINEADFSGEKCLDKVYVCVDPYPDGSGLVHTYYVSKNENIMYGTGGIFELKWGLSKPYWDIIQQSSVECKYVELGKSDENELGYSSCAAVELPIYRIKHQDGKYSDTYYKDQVASFCKSFLSNKDYSGDPCMQECLHLDELYPDLFEPEKTNECSLTDDMIAWIENILRWVKYIIPIVLIVLSIIEFIKALSSEKEDEMKKAQKNFVIRLIVAVLIFIIPLLIEFILDKMGFDATNCGIKNIGF